MKKEYKVGDCVKTIELGEGIIAEVNFTEDYYYKVASNNSKHCESYTKDWKNYEDNAYSSLVEDEIHPIIIGRWMLVSDDKTDWRKRFVIKAMGNKKQSYLVFANTENEEQLAYADDTIVFDYAKEIESEAEPDKKIESPEEQIDEMFNKALEEDENCYRRKSR